MYSIGDGKKVKHQQPTYMSDQRIIKAKQSMWVATAMMSRGLGGGWG